MDLAADTGSDQARKSRKKAIIGAGIVAFAVTAVAAGLLCFTYSEYETQSILARQRDMQQTVLDKSLDSIRVWRNEMVGQSRFISSSEMFRMFIADTRGFSQKQLAALAEPEALHSDDEDLRALAEQRAYMQDLLKDFVRRRAWTEARIVSLDGDDILSREFTPPLTASQKEIVKLAIDKKRPVFGPIRREKPILGQIPEQKEKSATGETGGDLFMDMADPFFEVLGGDEPRCSAVLLLTVPMSRPLATFLASSPQGEGIYPRIVDQISRVNRLVMFRDNHISMFALDKPFPDKSLAFGLRPALSTMVRGANSGQGGEVYSIGARPTLMDWLFVLETPARLVDELIRASEIQIYGLGALATIGLTLLAAFIFAQATSRQHAARANHLARLNHTITQQKLILDGVNKSLEAGLLLVDDKGFIQVANPAFRELSGAGAKDLKGIPLVDVLPAAASVSLTGEMRNVIENNESETAEITLSGPDGAERLYRVSLFPYKSEKGESSSSGSGCVAVFKDITIFRANAKKSAQRQEAILTAMDRALESVDPHLVGQSAKMARVSRLVADEMNMDAAQKETLRIASLLSQIGKLFVPRELLLKKEKLTPDERNEVGRAPEHADRILKDLHFDLPVRETVREMGERMDGSGPAGYSAAQISPAGRVLAAVNAFVAMTSPRAWRASSGMKVEDAIETLKSDKRFDQATVAALARIDGKTLSDIARQA